MKTSRIFLLFITIQLVVSVPMGFANGVATDTVSDQTRCSVCGMFVAKYPNWLARIQYSDPAQTRFFDGPKDMMVFYFNPERYDGPPREAIQDIFVKDYYSLNWLSAREAFYVIGSDVSAPWAMNLFHLQQGRLQNHSARTITAKRSSCSMISLRSLLSRCRQGRKCDDACSRISSHNNTALTLQKLAHYASFSFTLYFSPFAYIYRCNALFTCQTHGQ